MRPHAELPFAGHPTVGTGWVLLDEGLVGSDSAAFTLEEGVGPVPVRVDRGGGEMVLWMSHPPVKFGDVIGKRVDMAAGLGLTEGDLVPNVPIQVVTTGVPFVYVALKDAAAVGSHRLYSRMFGPHSLTRIVEDPATGSASGPLGAFAVRYGVVPRAPQVSIVSEQGTKMGRQSIIQIKLAYSTDPDIPERIEVGGSVVPVMTAELSVKS